MKMLMEVQGNSSLSAGLLHILKDDWMLSAFVKVFETVLSGLDKTPLLSTTSTRESIRSWTICSSLSQI